VNATTGCGNRSLILVNQPYGIGQPFQYTAKLCEAKYFVSDVSASVLISPSSTTAFFDSAEFTRNQKPLDLVHYNISQIETSFFGPDWSRKITGDGFISYEWSSADPNFDGPFLGISSAPQYGRDVQKMIESSTLVDDAQKLHQRYVGEMLLSSLTAQGLEKPQSIKAKVLSAERRIVVIVGVGTTISVLLFISSLCIIGVAFYTRLSRRPLNIYHEPGSIAAAASLIASSAKVRATFDGFDKLSRSSVQSRLGHLHFSLFRGELDVDTSSVASNVSKPANGQSHTPLHILKCSTN